MKFFSKKIKKGSCLFEKSKKSIFRTHQNNITMNRAIKISTLLIFLFTYYSFAQETPNSSKDPHNHVSHDINEGKTTFQNIVDKPLSFDSSFEAARFIENKGQWNSNILYRTELIDGYIYFQNNGIKYHFYDGSAIYDAAHNGGGEVLVKQHVVNVDFKNSNPEVIISSSKTFKQHKQSYFYGNKRAKDVKFYQEIKYENIYSNIDLVYHSFNDHIKYDFNVKVGGQPSDIKFDYQGAEHIFIHENGSLVIETSIGGIVEYAPYSYQEINGEKVEVKSEFVISNNEVSFNFPNSYDKTRELIIDPSLIASTYTGSTSDNWGNTAAHTASGELVIAGIVNGAGYPTTAGAFDLIYNGGTSTAAGGLASDVSISIFSDDGITLIASTYFGGSDDETPHSLVVDQSNGDIFLMGITRSADFPMVAGSFDNSHNGGGEDIFVARLSADLSTLLGSTFIGGTGADGTNVNADHDNVHTDTKFNYGDSHRGQLILDATGNVYVASSTRSADFNTTVGAFDETHNGVQDAVVFKLDNALSNLLYSTYLGGAGMDGGFGLALDASNNIYVTGATMSGDFPTTVGALDETFNGSVDGFIAMLNTTGTALISSSFLGTVNKDGGFYVDVDVNGDVYIMGLSMQGSYPVTAGTFSNANSNQFIHSVNSTLTATNFSTIYGSGGGGANSNISPTGFQVDSCLKIIVGGWGGLIGSGSTNGMPITPGAYQTVTDGRDFHFAVFDPNATNLLYATYFGESGGIGDHVDGGSSTFDSKGIIYQAVCASCGGTNGFPITAGAYSSTNNSANCNNAAFKFDLGIFTPGAAAIGAVGGGCLGTPVNFTNNSTNSVTYLWDFGDGSATSTATTPSHTYTATGTYTVELIAYNPTTCITSDTTTISIVIDQPIVTVTTNPVGGTICNGDNVTLTAAGANIYTWTPGGVVNPLVVSPLVTTTYQVIGADINGCEDTIQTTITVDPLPTVSAAGADQTLCQSPGTATLAGNTPVVGTGLWTLVSGTGTITTPTSPTSGLTGLGVGTNVFQWTISNGTCTASTDQVTITIDANPTVATAGADQNLCGTTISNLAGNTPVVGTGLWTLVSGTGTITTPTSPTSGITGLALGANVFQWTISNGTCIASSDQVTITVENDSDNDGICDNIDLDDDNDGIPDLVEGNGDSDGDGIPDSLDLDSETMME